MKKNLIKIIFIASFLPYLFAIVIGIISAFLGISFFSDKIYGLNALMLGLYFAFYSLIFIVPIVPFCLLFQICYILRKKIKRFKNIKLGNYVKVCCLIGIFLGLVLFGYSRSYELKKFIEKASAKQMINDAEEKIGYNKSDIMVSGIFNMPDYKYNHILIDYDKVEVGMLVNSGVDQFWKVKLQKISKDSLEYKHIINDYFLQADIPLNYPGKKLLSFYEEEIDIHRTIAFLLIFDDETIYFADNLKEKDTGYTRFSGLQWSEFFVGENIKFKN